MKRMTYENALTVVAQVIIDLGNKNMDTYVTEVLSAIDKKSPCWDCFYNEDCREEGADLLKRCADFYGVSNMMANILYIDSLLFLRHSYDKFLSMAPNRRLNKLVRETSKEMDEWGIDFLQSKAKAVGGNSKAMTSLLSRMKRIKIKNIKDLENKWDKKINMFMGALKKVKPHLKDIIEDKFTMRLVKSYQQGTSNAIDIISKYNRLPINNELKFVGKHALRSIKKQDPDKLNQVLENSDTKDKEEISLLLNPPKTNKGPITLDTHPEYYTKEGELRLVRPIKSGTEDLKYNPKWKVNTDNGWYAQGKDPDSGQWTYFYTEDYMAKKGKSKFGIVTKLQQELPKIRRNINKSFKSNSKREKLLALMVHLVDKGNFRIGNNLSEVDDVRGLHNLQVKHLKLGPKNILKFNYTGKKLKNQKANFKVDKKIWELIKEIIKSKKANDYIFTYKGKKISPNAVNNYLEDIGCPTTIHKFRHAKSTKLAKELLLDNPEITKDDSQKDKKKYLKECLEQIKDEMGHDSITTTKNYYIDPIVLNKFMKKFEVSAKVIAEVEDDSPPKEVFLDLSLEDEEEGDEEFNNWLTEMLPEVMDEKEKDPLKILRQE